MHRAKNCGRIAAGALRGNWEVRNYVPERFVCCNLDTTFRACAVSHPDTICLTKAEILETGYRAILHVRNVLDS